MQIVFVLKDKFYCTMNKCMCPWQSLTQFLSIGVYIQNLPYLYSLLLLVTVARYQIGFKTYLAFLGHILEAASVVRGTTLMPITAILSNKNMCN